jgi:hypothetical protein
MSTEVETRPAEADAFLPLVEIDMTAQDFAADWAHCDLISGYVARMVSHNRTDSLRYANLLSSALNELLETAFRSHDGAGRFACRIERNGAADRVRLTLPCSAEQAHFYREAIAAVHRASAAETYRGLLFAQGPVDPRIGLFELAVDYAAGISVDEAGPQRLRLTADLMLEGQ